jgi:hypothetical protein
MKAIRHIGASGLSNCVAATLMGLLIAISVFAGGTNTVQKLAAHAALMPPLPPVVKPGLLNTNVVPNTNIVLVGYIPLNLTNGVAITMVQQMSNHLWCVDLTIPMTVKLQRTFNFTNWCTAGWVTGEITFDCVVTNFPAAFYRGAVELRNDPPCDAATGTGATNSFSGMATNAPGSAATNSP